MQIGADFTAQEDGKGVEMIEHHETLRNDLSSVRYARTQVDLLLETEDDDLRDSALLLVSETVTNAMIHTTGDVTLNIKTEPGWIRVEVGDTSTRTPRIKSPENTSVSGRGVELIEALSRDWGVNSHRSGKTVWFELESAQAKEAREVLLETTRVIFSKAPTRLVRETLEHTDQTLRELLVHSGGSAEDVEAFAMASELEFGSLSDLAEEASGKGVEELDLSLELPASSGSVALDLLHALEDADHKAQDGDMLSPMASEDVKICRRWLLTEIATQLSGGRVTCDFPSQAKSIEDVMGAEETFKGQSTSLPRQRHYENS